MGAAFTYNGTQKQSFDNLEDVFSVVQLQPGRFFAPFHKPGQNMVSSQQTMQQTAVE